MIQTPSDSFRFRRQLPIVPGKLSQLNSIRPLILSDVVSQTKKDLAHRDLESLLGEALYAERKRIRQDRGNLFTRGRYQADRSLWGKVQNALIKPPAEADRMQVYDQILEHYANEIGGHFSPRMYHLATNAIPWGFSWLLNAASVQRFLPWRMVESLESRLHILGEVSLLQSLSKRGTILLVPTHQSNIDSVLIGYIIYLMSLPPFAYGAGLNLFSNPVLGFFMNRLGAYTVDRKKKNEIYKTVLKNYSIRILKEGIHSIFFPGGGRSRSGAIETKLKLGLLGTGLTAQTENILLGKPQPHVFVVPMVTSYHFVLEAGSLIDDHLEESGKHRFIMTNDESWQIKKVLSFFWKLFSSQSGITVRIGKPLDIFGNFVDENGRSLGPHGIEIDPKRWLTTRGVIQSDRRRDEEYTRELGIKLTDRFHKENTVLSSHLVAYAFFEALRVKYPEFDLYRLLRLTPEQRSLPYQNFVKMAEIYHQKLIEKANHGQLFLSRELQTSQTETWIQDGVTQLGLFHDVSVIKVRENAVWTEDMSLLYYYRNRLTGYHLSTLDSRKYEESGFLE